MTERHTMSDNFITICKERGYFFQCTDVQHLEKLLTSERGVPVYIGFDCTAASLHVGSLIQIMVLRWLQKCGHKPIVLMGGGTTKVGDPSGKDKSRQLLDDAGIAANMAGIKTVFEKFLRFGESASDAVMVNNADWLDNLNYISFLRDVGRHFSVNQMLTMESVKQRLERESHLSFLEFNYMILQAYDFTELAKRYGCRVQIGGSDQWGNIVNGTELHRRLTEGKGKELFGLTTPLLTTSAGAKMGKTADGAVWLNGDMYSPSQYWQFWRNTEDADVGRFLKLFTELSLDEIAKLEALEGAHINEAKKILATEATALLHGREAAEKAAEDARITFEQGLTTALAEIRIDGAEWAQPLPAWKLFALSGLVESGGEARRLIRGNGAKINDVAISDENQPIAFEGIALKLSSGKKKHILVTV
jgi:tyrosyl-tRNA synthetase